VKLRRIEEEKNKRIRKQKEIGKRKEIRIRTKGKEEKRKMERIFIMT